MAKFKCHVCGRCLPTDVKHDHHIIPRSVRKTEETVELCPLCHSAVHRIAQIVLSGSGYGELREMIRETYPDRDVALRATGLARAIVEATILAEDNPSPSGSPVSLRIYLTPEERSLLKLAARDSNLSVTAYIKSVVRSLILKFKNKSDDSNNSPHYL